MKSRDSIPYSTVQCHGEHGSSIPKGLKKIIKRSSHSKKALRALQDILVEDKGYRSLIGTTQAIDIIQGAQTPDPISKIAHPFQIQVASRATRSQNKLTLSSTTESPPKGMCGP